MLNVNIAESDSELFEDNPEEYIRRDIEGSDVDTRRRAACDLVKVLSKYFEGKIMEIFGAYIQVYTYMRKLIFCFGINIICMYLLYSCIFLDNVAKLCR